MAEFQLLRCMVTLGGDPSTIVYRHRGEPILFPELIVLMALHGDDAVNDVHVVGTCEMSQEEATIRLRTIYGKEEIDRIFPGARARLPTGDSSIPLCTLPIHVPKPTRPDNPDPQLRPLSGYTMPASMPRVSAEAQAEDAPTAEEIAAHTQDDAPDYDGEDSDLGLGPSRPSVADMPQTRVGFRGQAAQARRTPDHLPDVAQRQRRPSENDHNRPRG